MRTNQTALVLIGFQNDYFADDGILREAIEVDAESTQGNTVELIESLCPTDILIVSTPIIFTPNYEELVDPVGILKAIKEAGAFKKGRKGSETTPEIKKFCDRIEEVPGKRGLNAFSNTDLDKILQEKHISNVAIAGVVTSICIDSTGRTAHEKGYRVYVLSDCTCGRTKVEQDFYIKNVFPLYAEVIDRRTLLKQLKIR
ncbi:cysteine hydrolase [Acidobacteria bacterium AH-259-A15]|nr:cysteine hydrolase [Acidobacteria bacterium AH-259-A15]